MALIQTINKVIIIVCFGGGREACESSQPSLYKVTRERHFFHHRA